MNWMILAAAKPGAPADGGLMTWLPLILMLGVFWFILIVPQRKQQKQRQTMLGGLKKGDKVITIGGIHGEIVEIDEESVKLRVADKTELKFSRTAIAKVKGD